MILLEPAVHGIFVEVGSPLLVVLDGVPVVVTDQHPPTHVRPQEPLQRRVRVVLLIGVRVVIAMIGNPSNRSAFRCAGSYHRQWVFKPSGAKRETAMS